jgi:uncharacterized hydantoinase/oxoprolinase family protein
MAKIKDSMNIQKEERVEDSFEKSEGEGEIVEDSFDKIQEKICNDDGEVSSRVLMDHDLTEEEYQFELKNFQDMVEAVFKKIQEKNGNEELKSLPRVLWDFDLNEEADYEFDLNKFPEEDGEESSQHEFQPVIRKMLRKLLPKFY